MPVIVGLQEEGGRSWNLRSHVPVWVRITHELSQSACATHWRRAVGNRVDALGEFLLPWDRET